MLASISGTTVLAPCGALQKNCAVHIAMKAQSLAQSGMGIWSGQHGISAGIAIAACSSIAACMSPTTASAGLAIGVRIKPTTARIERT